MANTLKTLQGEIMASEVEAIFTDLVLTAPSMMNKSPTNTKVIVVGKTGIKYDLTTAITAAQAAAVLTAAMNFVAGAGHTVFDPRQVK
jgi:hypothetical protein